MYNEFLVFTGLPTTVDYMPSADLRNKFKYKIKVVYGVKSRDSAVGIVTEYGLDDQGVGVRVPIKSRIFSSLCGPDRL
jgi:hypothetical protein